MATVEILPIPLGSQFVERIGQNDPDDLNDFTVLFVFLENVSGLTAPSITLSSGSTLISLEGQNSVWKGVIRPPQTAGIVTITVAANVVSEGNPETSKEIRVSTGFPDTDAEQGTLLFNPISSPAYVAATPNRLKLFYTITNSRIHRLLSYTYDGTLLTSEQLDFVSRTNVSHAQPQYINGNYLFTSVNNQAALFRPSGSDLEFVESYEFPAVNLLETGPGFSTQPVTGALGKFPKLALFNHIGYKPKDDEALIYGLGSLGSNRFYRITGGYQSEVLGRVNINFRNSYAIKDNKLYTIGGSTGIYETDARPYLPVRAKTTLYPVFANEGDTIDLLQFAPRAARIVFDVGYDKPSYLSINSSNQLEITSNAVTETTPVLVKLKAINYIDATETESFKFYLVIQQVQRPIVRNVSELTMRAGSRYNLFDLVPDADSISFRSGRTRLPGSSLSNGFFRIGTEGGIAHFTARRGSLSSHFQINIHVVQESSPANFSDVFRHKVSIAGIDVSADVSQSPSVSASIDAILLNEYRANETTLSLKSNNTNNFRYNDDIPDNFWETHTLNPAGFNERIDIFIESLVDGSYISHLLFSGVIVRSVTDLSNASVQLQCVDTTTELRNTRVQDFGTLQKWSVLRQQSDEASYEGIYVPDNSLVPMQVGTGEAWHDRTKLTIRDLRLPSEGKPLTDTAYMTDSDLRTSGGFLPNNPLMRFKTQHRAEDARFLVNQIALNKNIYNAEIDLPPAELENPFILNRGSISFSVEDTRIQRLLTDWVYDATNDRILMLLSNPEAHISDLLVQYTLSSDASRVLYTFAKDIKAHRIARRNSTNYYILTSKPISQDRSAPNLPRPIDSTGYAYDAIAEESQIRIHHYNASTNTLTEHVANDDTRPPQLGIHYWVGVENIHYIDEFEGIVPDNRGTFKVHNSNLYYRYATPTEFGVARVNTSGTTTEMIDQPIGSYQNHLNFAFDVNTSGTIYFVYAQTTTVESITIASRTLYQNLGFTITNDLSSQSIPLEVNVNFFNNRGSGGRYIEVTGTDSNGQTLTQRATLGAIGNTRITLEEPYATITSISQNGFSSGSVTITTTPIVGTALSIKRRISGGSESTILQSFESFEDLTVLDDTGGAYLGAHECLFHNNYLYILAPIGRVDYDENEDEYSFSTSRSAGMVLYRCHVTASTPTLDVVKKYDFVQRGGCNLIVHDGAVHFVEHPPASTRFKPYNPDLDGYWTDAEETQTMGYNILPDPLGALKKVNASAEVESLGSLYHTDRPYNVAAARCLSFDGDLHIAMGYGVLDKLLRLNSLASQPENVQHLVYTRNLHYIVPEFAANDNRYTLLADLAKKTNATLSFENGLITLRDRSAYRAETDGATGTGTGGIDFEITNKAFPTAGYLIIEKELLQYTGIASGAFTGITRGMLGTDIVNHSNNTEIIYVDSLIKNDEIQSEILISTDLTRIYNVIRDSEENVEVKDEASIQKYGERPYTLNLGLTQHEPVWQEHIFQSYLTELKDPKKLVNMTLTPKNYLRVGHVIGLKYNQLVYAMRIVSVTYNKTSTQIRGRTV